jgi:hypothetical protein
MIGIVGHTESVVVVLERKKAVKESTARMTHVYAISDNDLTLS